MAVHWTGEQRQAIEVHDRDILVSAAAGSGKTAVLVERILEMVTRKEQPVDIDHLLVVTFTRAAAGEMKERILTALEERRAQDPENEHLQRQTSYIHHAQINTIDGFCGYVIRSYFHLIDLDPAYRVADEGELKLLKRDVVRQVLQEAYEAGEESFLQFAESYAPGKSDDGLEEQILDLYEAAMSHPWPRRWLCSCREQYAWQEESKFWESPWIREIQDEVTRKAKDALEVLQEGLALAMQEDGPRMYERALQADREFLERFLKASDYEARYGLIQNHKWERLSAKKDPAVSEQKRDRVKQLRETVKEQVKSFKETYFAQTKEEVLQSMENCSSAVHTLADLTLAFEAQFTQKKRQKNILDFSDMEHLALNILVEAKEDGTWVQTEAARELSRQFEEILIDEYQDSNYVQEMLLTSISRKAEGRRNLFMVGDVKQSIYRFRLANPELFMEKYHTYVDENPNTMRIDLACNFRSRKEVLDITNAAFGRMMRRSFGGVDYDDRAALHLGASYPEGEDCQTEILMMEKDGAALKASELTGSEKELEARMIGQKIRQMVGKKQIYDKELDGYRPMRYADCVILLRSISGFGETFGQVLQSMGIPAHVTTRTGYFTALEVVTLLNYLHICDNPRQDIPLAAVLHSPIGKVTSGELAQIRISFPQGDLYSSCRQYSKKGTDEALRKKMEGFLNTLDGIRDQVPYTPIHQLILTVLEKTGYGLYVQAMPGGSQRFANVSMLHEKARDFEKTSYRGLFNFIRYIEQLKKVQVDYGEANILGEGEDTVRIMTIHKSKGLEFPVVFLSGLGKKFNLRDLNASIIIHPDLGVALDSVDPRRRIRTTTLLKQAVRQKLLMESLSEELRVLYVAFTRAKEKLILTGMVDHLEKRMSECESLSRSASEQIPLRMMERGRDYWDWILPALTGREQNFTVSVMKPDELVTQEVQQQIDRQLGKERLYHWDGETIWDASLRETLQERFSFVYPFEGQRDVPVKVTVSELKQQHLSEETPAEELYFEPDVIPLIPRFIETDSGELTGADRGTAYHRVLELLDYERMHDEAAAACQLDQMEREGKLSHEMRSCIKERDLLQFGNSRIGERMRRAQQQGRLYREQPFTMSIPASEKDIRYQDCDSVLVQGIIDAYFFEEDGLILVDYKTDKVYREHELIEKYKSQLDYYADALERTTGKRVLEKVIYSVTLGREISVS